MIDPSYSIDALRVILGYYLYLMDWKRRNIDNRNYINKQRYCRYSMAAIKDKSVLASFLKRMHWIEAEMEQLGTWEARIQLIGDNIGALEKLSDDSYRH